VREERDERGEENRVEEDDGADEGEQAAHGRTYASPSASAAARSPATALSM
jgi:hypothetical protein